ncbi:MAG: GreA/GreB family elongation factor [Alphaproteobacteria bacterium]|nr:GreA/GreB family elongation factor [Alphaproteobacteria bacterium]
MFPHRFEIGRISLSSLARALIGKTTGDAFEVNTPSSGRTYKIAKGSLSRIAKPQL